MIRVLLLATDLERGGLPLRWVRLAPYLRLAGVEPILGSLAGRGPLAAELEAGGFATFSCDAASRFDATCLSRLAAHIRRLSPDIVLGALFHANLALRLVGRLDRDRPVITATVTIEIERRWHRWLESLTAGRSDYHVANSEAVADHVRTDLNFPADRVVVIHNGLDFDAVEVTPPISRHHYGIGEGEALVVWAGRMDPVKRLDILVRVIERVARHRRLVAVLLGDGPERLSMESFVSQHHLSPLIHFIGWSDNIIGWLKAADALLFPSMTEGAPNVVLEAVACGCPVVASDIPACREILSRPGLGCLVAPANVGGFAAALDHTLSVRSIRDRSALAPRLLLAQHDMRQVAASWRHLFDHAVQDSHA